MAEIPQDANKYKRELVILAMRGGQDSMKRAMGVLITEGEAGEAEAARIMRTASAQFNAAAVLLHARPESGR